MVSQNGHTVYVISGLPLLELSEEYRFLRITYTRIPTARTTSSEMVVGRMTPSSKQKGLPSPSTTSEGVAASVIWAGQAHAQRFEQVDSDQGHRLVRLVPSFASKILVEFAFIISILHIKYRKYYTKYKNIVTDRRVIFLPRRYFVSCSTSFSTPKSKAPVYIERHVIY